MDGILSEKDYDIEYEIPEHYKLTDNVVLYCVGSRWRIIQLNVMLIYSILYDKYITDDNKYDITLVVCPRSLRSVVFKGHYKIKLYDDDKMILEDEEKNILPIDLSVKIDKKNSILPSHRSEVKIMTLKNAMMLSPDASYVILKKNKQKKVKKIGSYYGDSKDYNESEINDGFINPKTLVYIIQYKSQKKDEEKYSIVVGKNANKERASGYDFKKNGFIEYFTKFQEKIINREGYIFPCLWYVAKKDYENARVVQIY
jgi:hypothetical protein